MPKRQTALMQIENLQEWKVFNPVFELNTPQFDKAFSSEYGIPKEFYLEHSISSTTNSKFEDNMCDNLFSGHGNPDSKLYFLRGHIGTGKTSFVHYMGAHKLPEKYKSVFFLYINCYKRFPKDSTTLDHFENVFRRVFKEKLVNEHPSKRKPWEFENEASLAQTILRSRGVDEVSNLEAIRELDRFKSDTLLPFLLTKCDLDRILIAVDNMDDCHFNIKEIAFSFAQSLSDIAMEYTDRKSTSISILIPLRNYTILSTDTEIYPSIDLPKLDVSDVMAIKIDHAKELIEANLGKHIREFIPRTTTRKREITFANGQTKTIHERLISGKWLVLENVTTLLKKFSRKTSLRARHGLLYFIEKMSAGNLMLVTRNTYYIFHSCKLNMSELIHFSFTSEDEPSYKELLSKLESASYGPPIIYDLTMAIRYPFYDKGHNCIANLFNVKNSYAPNDYKNTLGIVRMMCYVNNNDNVIRRSLYDAMQNIGYDVDYIEESLKKLLNNCLVSTDYGTKLEDLDDDTLIELSSAGKYMLESTIANHRYLSYVGEDVPMEEEFIIPIQDKCTLGKTERIREKVDESVNKFVSFLAKEEENEIKWLTSVRGWERNSFLRDYSVKYKDRHTTITEHIRDRLDDQLDSKK